VRAVLSHANHLQDVAARESDLERVLFACDELAGFVHACGLVRPEGLATLEPRSVRKKLKQKSFAAGVNRDDVYAGVAGLGVELDAHIQVVIDALKPIHAELGLPG
jgi:predicted hydrolase (HD superfamily)